MQPIRREQVVKAAMHCISTIGIHKSSMHKIAAEAGMTSSLIVHYFKDRTSLLEAVYMHIYTLMNEEVRRRVAKATHPIDRLKAICAAQACDEMLEREIVVTWVALFALIPEIPSLARLDDIYARRMRSNMIYHLCKTGLPRNDARMIANEIPPLIDGLWLRKAAQPDMCNSQMRAIVADYLERNIPTMIPGKQP
jgi:transcriptional repressor BetI